MKCLTNSLSTVPDQINESATECVRKTRRVLQVADNKSWKVLEFERVSLPVTRTEGGECRRGKVSFPPFVPAAAALRRTPLPVTITGAGPIDLPPSTHGVTDRRNCRGEKRWRALYFLPRTVQSIIDFTPDCRVRVMLRGVEGWGEGRVRFLTTLDGLRRRSINRRTGLCRIRCRA